MELYFDENVEIKVDFLGFKETMMKNILILFFF